VKAEDGSTSEPSWKTKQKSHFLKIRTQEALQPAAADRRPRHTQLDFQDPDGAADSASTLLPVTIQLLHGHHLQTPNPNTITTRTPNRTHFTSKPFNSIRLHWKSIHTIQRSHLITHPATLPNTSLASSKHHTNWGSNSPLSHSPSY